MTMRSRLLVDADVLAYQAGHQSSTKTDWGGGKWSYTGDVGEGLGRAEAYLSDLVEAYPDRDVVMMFSGDLKDNFRMGVYPQYKAKRAGNPFTKPPHFAALREEMIKHPDWKTVCCPNIEADDLLGITAKSDDIIVSIDKDLMTIPCLHVNLRDVGCTPTRVTQEEADTFLWTQTIMGDTVDDIPGIKGVGKIKAERIMSAYDERDYPTHWSYVREVYINHGHTEADALMNHRLVRILRPGEYDMDTEEVTLWTP